MSRLNYGRVVAGALLLAAILGRPEALSAQLDPLLMIKKGTPATPVKPNVIFAVDTSARMQYDADGTYYDPYNYEDFVLPWEANIGVNGANTNDYYRRKYVNLVHSNNGSDKFRADTIQTVGDRITPGYADFYSKTRLLVARVALAKALNDNSSVTRFGLIKTRQSSPSWGTAKNSAPVQVNDSNQTVSETGSTSKWAVTRTTVSAKNGSIASVQAPLVLTDAVTANTSVLATLNLGVGASGALIPAGDDGATDIDSPVERMWAEASASVSNPSSIRPLRASVSASMARNDESPSLAPVAR